MLIGTFSRHTTWAVIATVGIVLAAVYMLWIFQRIMTGPVRGAAVSSTTTSGDQPVPVAVGAPRRGDGDPGRLADDRPRAPTGSGQARFGDLKAREIAVLTPLVVLIIGLGIYPKPVLDVINPTSVQTMIDAGYTDVVPGRWQLMAGFVGGAGGGAGPGSDRRSGDRPDRRDAGADHPRGGLPQRGARSGRCRSGSATSCRSSLSLLAIIAAGVWTVVGGAHGRYAVTFNGAIAVDSATYVIWGVVLVLALVSVSLMADRVSEPGGAFAAQAAARIGSTRDRVATEVATPMQTEVFPLTLFAIGGMLVFPAASDLLTLFVALEVLSLPLYLMCGLARRRRLISQEAAVKYFLLGAFTSAILLYGIALLYGYAGSIRFSAISQASQTGGSSDALLLVGIALLIVGLLFKASVGPFHLWTPDVYQGAPTPVTAFMAACTKVAAFAAMLRVFLTALQPMAWSWRPVLWVVAIAVDDDRRDPRDHPDRHEADARVLVGGARRLPAARRHGAEPHGRLGDHVLPAHLRIRDDRRVRAADPGAQGTTTRRRTCRTGPGWPNDHRCWPGLRPSSCSRSPASR